METVCNCRPRAGRSLEMALRLQTNKQRRIHLAEYALVSGQKEFADARFPGPLPLSSSTQTNKRERDGGPGIGPPRSWSTLTHQWAVADRFFFQLSKRVLRVLGQVSFVPLQIRRCDLVSEY